ncbi:FecR family protein [Mucilaginibacter defluvii]
MNDLDKRYFADLLKRYRNGKATEEEKNFLVAYYNVFDINEDAVDETDNTDAIKRRLKLRIDGQIGFNKTNHYKSVWLRYAAAAVILIGIMAGGYTFFSRKHKAQQLATVSDVAPGSNKAVLTLGNGQRIVLDDSGKGEIARQAGISITKTANGQIIYKTESSASSLEQPAVQNTVSTPKGGQYTVILPDGTRVFLNAASTITYPSHFAGNQRLVKLNGEAYFEVAKNKVMPFRVISNNQVVEVLGTHFNINAYTDEGSIKTTLLEGSVKVTSGISSVTIKPGQQAVVNNNTLSSKQVDLDEETAWKNGVFAFEDADLRSVMRQVSRWYDVDVVYDDSLPDDKFYGEISRNSKLSEVFKILELNNFKFTLKGKTVTVSYAPKAL